MSNEWWCSTASPNIILNRLIGGFRHTKSSSVLIIKSGVQDTLLVSQTSTIASIMRVYLRLECIEKLCKNQLCWKYCLRYRCSDKCNRLQMWFWIQQYRLYRSCVIVSWLTEFRYSRLLSLQKRHYVDEYQLCGGLSRTIVFRIGFSLKFNLWKLDIWLGSDFISTCWWPECSQTTKRSSMNNQAINILPNPQCSE